MENAALDGTVTYCFVPSKSADSSPFGRATSLTAPPWCEPVWPLPVRSGSFPDGLFMAQYATGPSARTTSSYVSPFLPASLAAPPDAAVPPALDPPLPASPPPDPPLPPPAPVLPAPAEFA